jgi:3-oxoacyl-[acyl-carrier protein] reductase
MQIDLANKTIFISGGTSVIGRAIIEECLAVHARVFFTYHNNKQMAAKLAKHGARGFCVDLLDRAQIKALKEALKKETIAIDLLINNAAMVNDKAVIHLSEKEWDDILAVNLTGTVFVTKTLLPFLYKSDQGKVLTITSQVGEHGAYGQANYAASKGGLISFTKTLAKELGRKKILVNALNPGFIDSPMTAQVPDAVRQENIMKSCLASYGNPREIAHFVVFYASSFISNVSGQIFSLDSRII